MHQSTKSLKEPKHCVTFTPQKLAGCLAKHRLGRQAEGPGSEKERLGCGDLLSADLVVGGYLPAWHWAHPPLVLFAGGVLFLLTPSCEWIVLFFVVTSPGCAWWASGVAPSLCVSLCVLPVVLPYGRLHHAVLPQGRTTDRIPGHPLHRRTSSTQPQTDQQPEAGPLGPCSLLV